MKDNQDIPDDWAVCESKLDGTMTEEHYTENTFSDIPKYRSTKGCIAMCIKCVHKWRLFEHDPKKDYTQYKLPNDEQLAQLEYKEIKLDYKAQAPREQGAELYKNLTTSFIQNNLKHKITQSSLHFMPEHPTADDFKMKMLVYHPDMGGEITSASIQ